ncbi:preprotein translocase subunit YajC [Rothia amarae]|uniref:preprotein translocase subunit YajC n=1 Tax=Rothia amarae TaxID=169480 RepID=UPI001246C8A4
MLNSIENLHASSVLNAAEGGGAGGNSLFMILLMGIFVVMLFILPARRQRKVQQELKQRQDQLVPGTRVMTNFGLFGSVVEVNRDENYVLLNIAADTVVKVHLSTVTTLVDEEKQNESSTGTSSVVEQETAVEREGGASSIEFPQERDNRHQ